MSERRPTGRQTTCLPVFRGRRPARERLDETSSAAGRPAAECEFLEPGLSSGRGPVMISKGDDHGHQRASSRYRRVVGAGGHPRRRGRRRPRAAGCVADGVSAARIGHHRRRTGGVHPAGRPRGGAGRCRGHFGRDQHVRRPRRFGHRHPRRAAPHAGAGHRLRARPRLVRGRAHRLGRGPHRHGSRREHGRGRASAGGREDRLGRQVGV